VEIIAKAGAVLAADRRVPRRGSRGGQLLGTDDIGSGAQENVAIVDGLIVALDRISARSRARLVLVMATNLIDGFDPAVVRRASIYQFGRPDASARKQIHDDRLGDVLDRSIKHVDAARCSLCSTWWAAVAADRRCARSTVLTFYCGPSPFSPVDLLDPRQS
jgi:hypothetical protein